MNLILASASPRRKEILSLLKIPFQVIPAHIEEIIKNQDDVKRLAQDKALKVYGDNPDSIVIGADTIVVVGNEILEKPKDLSEAKKMLQKLSGKAHNVITGVCIVSEKTKIAGIAITEVFVQVLKEWEIDHYLQEEHILDAAGAYKIQGSFSRFICKIEGDFFNVVGLPLNWVYERLKFNFNLS